ERRTFMVDYIESKVGSEGKILIEISDARGNVGFRKDPTKQEKKIVDNAFNQALNTIRLAASSVLETLNTLEQKPDQVKIDFAIKVDAAAGAMLATGNSGDAQLRVSLGWHTTPPEKEDA
ncbi:MAG: CU044_2847 family protein, partial [Anaerolineae bacterium]